jgi:glycosyltransferase involved in cell wall biosynthesis
MKVLFDTSILIGGHSARGVGMYARNLEKELAKLDEIKLLEHHGEVSKQSKDKPDITHYPFFDLFFDTLPVNPIKKTVVTIHDVIPLVFSEQYKPGIKGRARFLKQKLALKTVSAVITDSQASKKDIIKYLNVPESKIHIIYLAANPDLKPQEEKIIKRVARKYKLPQRYLLYVGDINYNKNIPQLIKMLKFLPKDINLICLGRNFTPQEIPEWQWIETQMALSNVVDRVVFLDNILTESKEELAAIYSGAEVYIHPSIYEGFGLPLLEAMRCKTPVVCGKNSSLVEVGGENVIFAGNDFSDGSSDTTNKKTEPLPSLSAEDMAKAVEEVLSWSKTKRSNWLKEAYKWQENFAWEKVAQETAKVYAKVFE